MRKRVVLLTFLVVSFCMTGCVSDAEYKALEGRVSYLEEQLATKDSSTTVKAESIRSQMEEPEELETSETAYTYRIDDLSDQNVVEECQYYFNNIPYQGESYDDYMATLKATPVNSQNDYGVAYRFYENSIDNRSINCDAITDIGVIGTQTEMDGSIGYSSNYYGVSVKMTIREYDRAANIYALLYDVIVDENYKEINDTRDSTIWSANAMYYYTDSSAMGVEFMSMSKESSGYILSATYYRRR